MPRPFDRHTLSRVAVGLLAVYWVAIFTGTHWPKAPQFVQGNSDKVLHFLGYAGLAALCSLAFSLSRQAKLRRMTWQQCVLIVAVLAAYGGLDEVTQPLVGRSCELLDWIADLCGMCAGIASVQCLLMLVEKFGPQQAE